MDLIRLETQDGVTIDALNNLPKDDIVRVAEWVIRNQEVGLDPGVQEDKDEDAPDYDRSIDRLADKLADFVASLPSVYDVDANCGLEFTTSVRSPDGTWKEKKLSEEGMVIGLTIDLKEDDDEGITKEATEELFKPDSVAKYEELVRGFLKGQPYRAATIGLDQSDDGNYCLSVWLWKDRVGRTSPWS